MLFTYLGYIFQLKLKNYFIKMLVGKGLLDRKLNRTNMHNNTHKFSHHRINNTCQIR